MTRPFNEHNKRLRNNKNNNNKNIKTPSKIIFVHHGFE